MRRFWALVLATTLGAVGCRIEQTPEEFFDHQVSPFAEREASRDELRTRLLAVGQALRRGSQGDVLAALAPVSDVYVFAAPDREELRAPADVAAALDQIAGQAATEVEHLEVTISPRNNVAWFRARWRVTQAVARTATIHFSGVFLREGGEWRLVEGHLSETLNPEPPPEPVDTPAAGG